MSTPTLQLVQGGKVEPLKLTGFSRDHHFGECALAYFDRRPTDAEMNFLQECMSRAVALMPDELRDQP